ncbi:MAG: zinc-binding dehydrogenase [Gemmatimonadetes bacterium]|nr:zinc-binding dehydrogenase [Gemmatimonadota bacterium]
MRALTLAGHGGLDQLQLRHDLPEGPDPGPGEVRLRVMAAALNHLDVFLVAGLPGITIEPPFVVATDGAGIVDAVGAGVTHVKAGDHAIVNPGVSCGACEYCLAGEQPLCVKFAILGEHRPGFAAERVVVPAGNVAAIPAHVPWEQAAAFPLATLTAWRMVVTRAQVKAGDDVLIWGIGGGVALAALAICVARGARVWVTSSSPDKLARAKALGAHDGLDYTTQEVGRAIRQATNKRGVDVVIDSVGEATWSQSLMALGKRGRLVTCGGTSGPMVQTDVRRLFWNQWSLLGSTMGSDAEFAAIVDEFRAGRLVPQVDSVHPLADGRAAYERLASGRQFGKVVIRVAEGA